MAWNTPKTDWLATDILSASAMNRIEGNILHLLYKVPLYATSTFASNTYTVSISEINDYYEGLVIIFKASASNTGACSLKLNSLSAKAIKLNNGQDPFDGAIQQNGIYIVVYDGTQFRLLNPTYAFYA